MATETIQAEQAPKEQQSFAVASLIFCILGGIVSIGAGIYLAGLSSVNSNSMFEAIANGIGWYCIGKGLFMMASPFQLRGAAYSLLRGL